MGKWKDIQLALAEKVILEDQFPKPPKYFSGVDISYKRFSSKTVREKSLSIFEELGVYKEDVKEILNSGRRWVDIGICTAVVMDTNFKVIEEKTLIDLVKVPYIPGFLSFRELPLTKKTLLTLKRKPDITFVSGNGILHPRFLGLASHLGVELGISTVGVAKKLLCGEEKESIVECKGRVVGQRLGNIYVSPGHRITLESAVEFTRMFLRGHRLPEPLHLADQISRGKIELFRTGNKIK